MSSAEKEKKVLGKSVVMKDNDILESKRKLSLDVETRNQLVNQIAEDVYFLTNCNIMDYSLLVGIHTLNDADNME